MPQPINAPTSAGITRPRSPDTPENQSAQPRAGPQSDRCVWMRRDHPARASGVMPCGRAPLPHRYSLRQATEPAAPSGNKTDLSERIFPKEAATRITGL
jgi:hypothetical protein